MGNPLFAAHENKRLELYGKTDESNLFCSAIPEYIGLERWFVEIYTTNRHWLFQTVTRIWQNGLQQKWDGWSIWLIGINDKNLTANYVFPVTQEYIHFRKIAAVVVFHAMLCILASVIFAAEYLL